VKFNYIFFGSLLWLFLSSACRKESGFIPDYNRGEPYYSDLSFEHLWSESVEPGERENFLRGVKHTSDLILLITSRWLGAFSMETGAMLWKYEPEHDQTIWEDSDLIESGDKLILFQSAWGIMTILNKNTGQLIERKRFQDIPGIQGSPLSVGKWNDKIIVYTRHLYEPDDDMGFHNVYDLNPFDMSVKLLASEEGVHSSSHVKRILIDTLDSKAYVYFRAEEDGIRQMNFLEIDLINHSYRKQRIQLTSALHFHVHADIPIVKINNLLLIELGSEFGTTAINISDGSIVWNKEGGVVAGDSEKFYPFYHLGRLYLSSIVQFLNVDILTGKQIWSNDGYFISRTGIDFYPNKDLAIKFHNYRSSLGILDLNDGSTLVKVDASSLGNAKHFETNPLYIEKLDAWVVGTDDFTLHCFKWPFK
jgi:outer membrane protein assembly factor BamB